MNRLAIVAALIILASCSGETNYESFIQNRTDRDIIILLYNDGFPRGDTLRISSNSTKSISRGSSNQAEEEEPDCAERIDSAFVEIDGGGTLEKDISISANWQVETDKTQNIPEKFDHKCTFSINDSDITE
ncbi:hypothetical protein O3Q51_15315 [Cryomorphaceae bacterium 1068]|nr:hypothetical protein [Cryomorphaceae bacterium 1068]